MSADYAIEIRSLTKKYRDFTAVDALTLDIGRGELFSLLGVNGAGKTTTIKMLSCLTPPDSGDALLLGDSIAKNPFAVKEKINVSPQETAVAMNLTVRENLEFAAGVYGFGRDEAKKRAQQQIVAFKLGGSEKKRAKTLSGGTQRRLSIAMALISSPQILFLDEPTLGLDVLARRELWKVIEGLKGRVTIILTTHYMEEAEALSDRIGIMAAGKLKALGTAEELIVLSKAKNFEEAFIALVSEGGDGR
jgi:ABC-2 type transport system ATP-binding protein